MLTLEQKHELVDTAVALFETANTTTSGGVFIDIGHFRNDSVSYYDPYASTDPLIREMSRKAYVAEFYKVCGKSLDEADFDTVTKEIGYIASVMGDLMMGGSAEDVRRMLTEPQELTVPLDLHSRDHVWGKA